MAKCLDDKQPLYVIYAFQDKVNLHISSTEHATHMLCDVSCYDNLFLQRYKEKADDILDTDR